MSNPWEQAQQQVSGGGGQGDGGQSQLAESYEGKPSSLFSGGEGAGPSLFNKTHAVGTTRTGIIEKAPYDRHSTNVAGKLKYWQEGQKQPVLDARNPATGEPNRKVLDTVIVLDTEYTMDAAEAKALEREEPYEGGTRSVILKGDDLKKIKKAIQKYNASAAPADKITDDPSMEGKRLTVTRTAEKPNPNGGHSIKIHEYEISKA